MQGRLVLAFTALLALALLVSGWASVQQVRNRFADVMGENARQLSGTLALAAAQASYDGDRDALGRVLDDLAKSRNIVFVAFISPTGDVLAVRSRDPQLARTFAGTIPSTRALMQVTHQRTASGEPFVEVAAPVLSSVDSASPRPGGRLNGYVTVGVSLAHEEAQLERIAMSGFLIGGTMLMLTLPMAFVLVHRLFGPIRSLVDATARIVAGRLDTRVDVHRDDLIGELAQSFNEMVRWVRQQQSDLAQVNAQLAEANRDLETRIEQRTAQLETANRRLSEEISEKEDFLRTVSHDLNAPLRNIDGMVQMLLLKKREQLDGDIVNRLERIKRNVEVETDLISELLELSRIKTRRQKLESVELESLVWELRGLFENDLRTRGIALIVEASLPVMTCERTRLRQVFQNLIDNAIKYMRDDEPREIRVGCVVRLTEAEFYVRDTGIGIHPEDLERVFHVFRRGRNAQGGPASGKGVGLASVKSIIETYNGRIWVESTLGEGTTFRFTVNGQFVPAAIAQMNQGAARTRQLAAAAAEQLERSWSDDTGGAPA
jgi:signal transduction histidine kinase